jgi:hypothetical protein
LNPIGEQQDCVKALIQVIFDEKKLKNQSRHRERLSTAGAVLQQVVDVAPLLAVLFYHSGQRLQRLDLVLAWWNPSAPSKRIVQSSAWICRCRA